MTMLKLVDGPEKSGLISAYAQTLPPDRVRGLPGNGILAPRGANRRRSG